MPIPPRPQGGRTRAARARWPRGSKPSAAKPSRSWTRLWGSPSTRPPGVRARAPGADRSCQHRAVDAGEGRRKRAAQTGVRQNAGAVAVGGGSPGKIAALAGTGEAAKQIENHPPPPPESGCPGREGMYRGPAGRPDRSGFRAEKGGQQLIEGSLWWRDAADVAHIQPQSRQEANYERQSRPAVVQAADYDARLASRSCGAALGSLRPRTRPTCA